MNFLCCQLINFKQIFNLKKLNGKGLKDTLKARHKFQYQE